MTSKYEAAMHFYLKTNQMFYHILSPFAKPGYSTIEGSDVHM